MFFTEGDVYDRQQIADVLGAQKTGYLPLNEKGEVACGVFDAATEAVTHFSGDLDVLPKRISKGARLLEKGDQIPVFLKIAAKQWQYAGMHRFNGLAKDKRSIESAKRDTGRDDIAAVLKFERVQSQGARR